MIFFTEMTLLESAKKAEKLKNIRYELKSDEEIITGEEGDSNVFQVICCQIIFNCTYPD